MKNPDNLFHKSDNISNNSGSGKVISIGASVRSSFHIQDGLIYTRGEDNWLYVVDINRATVGWTLDLSEEEE